MGEEKSALAAVVAADVELMALRAEEAEIVAQQEADEADADHDAASGARLNEIYERMQVSSRQCGCSSTPNLNINPKL